MLRFAAAVGADDGGHAVAMELQFGAVAEGLKSKDLQLLQFEQDPLLRSGSAFDSVAQHKAEVHLRLEQGPRACPRVAAGDAYYRQCTC